MGDMQVGDANPGMTFTTTLNVTLIPNYSPTIKHTTIIQFIIPTLSRLQSSDGTVHRLEAKNW